MTPAAMHKAAFEAVWGPPPVTFETRCYEILSIRVEDNTLIVALEYWNQEDPGRRTHLVWKYPNPDVWRPVFPGETPQAHKHLEVEQEDGTFTTVDVPVVSDPYYLAATEMNAFINFHRAAGGE